MPFNIRQFANGIARNGFAREGFFDVTITIPPALGFQDSAGVSRALNGLCTASNLPARQATVDAVKTDGLGVIRQFARGMQYSALDVTFYCDIDSEILKFINAWMDFIFQTKTQNNRNDFNLLEYRDNYICPELTLNLYNDVIDVENLDSSGSANGKKTASWKFTEAFPYSAGPVNFSWGSRNNLVLYPVAFLYHQYSYEGQARGPSIDNLSTTLQTSKFNNQPVRGTQFIGDSAVRGRPVGLREP